MRYILKIPEETCPEEVADDLRELSFNAVAVEGEQRVVVTGVMHASLINRLRADNGIEVLSEDEA